jgi:hypothetical protein
MRRRQFSPPKKTRRTWIRVSPIPATQTFDHVIIRIRADAQMPTLIHAGGIDSPRLTTDLSITKEIVPFVDDIIR